MKKLFPTLLMAFAALFSVSCTDNEPGGGDGDGGGQEPAETRLFPATANIKNATALMVYNGTEGRSIEGEFNRRGLYQMDAEGNISLVAIYCVTDTAGNVTEYEHTISVVPGQIKAAGKNFVALYWCEYYDEDGDPVDSTQYRNLLIDKASEKIYSMDELLEQGIDVYAAKFLDETSGSMLVYSEGNFTVGRLSVKDGKVTYKQLNANDKGFFPFGVYESPSGVIFSQSEYFYDNNIALLFPNGGYDYLADYKLPVLPRPLTGLEGNLAYPIGYPEDVVNWNQKCLARVGDEVVALRLYELFAIPNEGEVHQFEYANISNFRIGNAPGDVRVSEGQNLNYVTHTGNMGYTHSIEGFCAVGDNVVFEIRDTNLPDFGAFLIYNAKSRELSALDPSFSTKKAMGLISGASFGGKVWAVRSAEGARGTEVLWIDPENRTSGSIDLQLDGIDVTSVDTDYQTGRFVINGVRRSDSYNCVTTFDLTTLKTETLLSTPSRLELDLILLN